MECKEFRRLLAADADHESSAGETLALAAHRRECTACRAETERIAELKAAIRMHAPVYGASAELRSRIAASLPEASAAAAGARAARGRFAAWWRSPLLAGFAAAALVAWTLMLLPLRGTDEEQQLLDEIVSAHARSLQVEHLTDVPSSDQHTVKPWFGNKLDFSPPVSDYAAAGFALVGGRLDIIKHRPVAAVVYRHRLHMINLFVWPDAGAPRKAESRTARGYNTIRWADAGMDYWLVSDLNEAELERLAGLLHGQQGTRPSP